MSTLPALTFGALLRRARLAAGLSQEELAERARLSREAISTLERGTRRAPRQETIALLAEALQLSPEERARLEAAARGRLAPVTAPALALLPSLAAPPGGLPISEDKTQQDSSGAASYRAPASSPNRHRFLAKVQSFWIDGVLEQSLHGAVLIALGLHEHADALANPWSLVFQQPPRPAHPLPNGTRITQAYDQAGGELLILGEPGSGKTTLLLELARDLVQRAWQDQAQPMPVILNLSSWAVKRQPLAGWLVEELNDKYQVPRRIARTWVADDQLLLLLDGLDEVTPASQAACIEAINRYRQDHGLVSLVVCSRSIDYLAQTARLLLDCAVVVEPLTAEQIDGYVASGGEPLAAIGTALRADPLLQALTTTPLMLSVLALAYVGKPMGALPASGSLEEQRRQVFATYTERMLQRRGTRKRYTPEQTIAWLSWLARQLVRHRQTSFSIEQVQLDWLPSPRWGWLTLCSGIAGIIGLFCFLIFELSTPRGTPLPKLVGSLLFGGVNTLLYLLLNGLLVSLERERDVTRKSVKADWSWLHVRQRLAAVLGNRVVYGFLFVVPNDLIFLHFGSNNVLNEEVFLNGIAIWIFYAVLGKFETKIQPVEVVSWSWHKVRRHLPQLLVLGLGGGVLLGSLIDLAIFWWRHDLQSGLMPFVLPILVLGLGIVVTLAVVRGVSYEVLETHHRTRPNQGIRNSLRNGVVFGLVYGLLVGVLSGTILTFVRVVASTHLQPGALLEIGLSDGIGFGVGTAAMVWASSGGFASVQHGLLRLRLWRVGCMPWRYARFLDNAAECLLLQKVGGGYIFMHRLLLDYFATL